MIKNILSAGLVLFFSSSIVAATEASGMLWMSKSQSLVTKDDVFTYQVEVRKKIGIDHGSDSVQVKIYKGEVNSSLVHTIPLVVPGIKGYVRDVSFIDINNDRMAISFDIEMKAMDGLILKEVILVGINGKTKTVIEAKGVDLYQELLKR